jgi:hypothetical protein
MTTGVLNALSVLFATIYTAMVIMAAIEALDAHRRRR